VFGKVVDAFPGLRTGMSSSTSPLATSLHQPSLDDHWEIRKLCLWKVSSISTLDVKMGFLIGCYLKFEQCLSTPITYKYIIGISQHYSAIAKHYL